jgi:predicted nucleic acid-binding protein
VKPTLIDTSVVVALLDRSENSHPSCVQAVDALESPLVTCEAVIAESCYLLRNLRGAAEAVLENVTRGVFQITFRLSSAAADVRRILRKYADLPADFADACLIQLAGELRSGDILTLDRDFQIYRWGANKPFRFLIPPG